MQNFRALGALPPDPRASGGWGLCPQTPSLPLASGGWGLRPQTPQTAPPIANFWLRAWKKYNIPNKMHASKSESTQGPQAISNLFNKYFTEIGVNLASTIETPTIIDGKFNATSLI